MSAGGAGRKLGIAAAQRRRSARVKRAPAPTLARLLDPCPPRSPDMAPRKIVLAVDASPVRLVSLLTPPPARCPCAAPAPATAPARFRDTLMWRGAHGVSGWGAAAADSADAAHHPPRLCTCSLDALRWATKSLMGQDTELHLVSVLESGLAHEASRGCW